MCIYEDLIIEFLGDEIRDERLYSLCTCEKNNKITAEKLLYIGKTMNMCERFKEGHKVTQFLSDPIYDDTTKKVYLVEVDIFNVFEIELAGLNDSILEFTPLEAISNKDLASDILTFVERFFITYYKIPVHNIRDKTPKVDFAKWPIVSNPEIITIRDFQNSSCFFEKVTFSMKEYDIDDILAEPRRIYQESMKNSEKKLKKYK